MTAINPSARSESTLRRISARDRRRAAMHEAAHVIIARHLGFISWAELKPTRVADPRCDKLWIGKATRAPIHRPETPSDRGMISVAGAIAEAYWEGHMFDDITEEFFWDDDVYVMSDSDWSGAGCLPGCPTPEFLNYVSESAKLLEPENGALWPKVMQEARFLIECTRID